MQTSRSEWKNNSGRIVILLFAILGGALGYLEYYATDAVGYMFMIPEEINEFSMERIGSLSDILTSQINHWHTVNGRFIVHFIVQIFCGLLPGWVWAIANALVYGILAWSCSILPADGTKPTSLCDKTELSYKRLLIFASLLLILLPTLFFSPPMQINYVWAYLIELVFLSFLLGNKDNTRNIWCRIGLILLSFAAGEWNEAFTVPIGIGLLTVLIHRRGRLTAWEWTGGLAFLAGAVILGFAPGNFVRLTDISSTVIDRSSILRAFLFAFYPLIAGLASIILLFGWKNALSVWRKRVDTDWKLMITATIIGSYVFGAVLEFSSGHRVVAVVGLMSVIAVKLISDHCDFRKTGLIIVSAVGLVAAEYAIYSTIDTRERYSLYDRLYRESEDGRVYVPIEKMTREWRETRFACFYMTYLRKSEDPDAPAIKILPDAARSIPRDSDFNAVIRLTDRAYLLVRSEKEPGEFKLRRRLGVPGTALSIPVSDRELDFDSPSSDIPVDTLPLVRLGLYINERPYVDSEPYYQPLTRR